MITEFSQTNFSKDLIIKKDIDAEVGIKEYWVVNLQDSQLKIFKNLVKQKYTSELTLETGLISPLSFPDVLIDIQRLISS